MTKIILSVEIDNKKSFEDFKTFILKFSKKEKIYFCETEENILKLNQTGG